MALAVLRLMTRSNLVGCVTGRSAGFSPLRIDRHSCRLGKKNRQNRPNKSSAAVGDGIVLEEHRRNLVADCKRDNVLAPVDE
jgi:hypothetical protein